MPIPRQYPKNISSLNGLKLTCEGDEAGLTAKLISLQLAKDENNNDITAADYEIADGLNLGHLIFEEFTTEVDASSRTAIHQTQKEPLVCKGRAFVAGQAKNIIVFRERLA
ncbi:MAG TPA: hypothetical protein VN844_07170 [Pyrinomonadaceae bacterium]|nr:hypothetical protein [Pyrinomonadaceae bacterium]